MDDPKRYIEKKRDFVKNEVNERTKNGEKIQGIIYELSERFICHPRTVENWLYHKPRNEKHSY